MNATPFGDGLFEDPGRDDRFDDPERRRTGDSEDEFVQESNELWIGVHVMSQFVFCPRSGMITYEQGGEDDGEIERPRTSRLDWLPDYQIPLIEKELDQVLRELSMVAVGASVWAMMLGIAAVAIDPVLACLLVLPMLVFVPIVKRRLRVYLVLRRRLRLAQHAKPRMPDENMPVNQIVNWWELLKAGYEASKPREPYRDKALRLSGQPYLILTYKGQRLPVIRKWKGKEELYAKDYARCAAYAHLIKTSERATVPFAIILFGNKYDSVAVPITKKSEELFRRGLKDSQEILTRFATGKREVRKPSSASRCRGCLFGAPRRCKPGKSETVLRGVTVQPRCTTGINGDDYHSTCGDRFRDGVPPHARSLTLGLIE